MGELADQQYRAIGEAISRDRNWPELEDELLLNHRQILAITASAIKIGDLIIYDRMIWEAKGEILESVINQNGSLLITLIDQLEGAFKDDGQAPAFWASLGRTVRASRRAIQMVTERLLLFSVRLADFGACMRAWLDSSAEMEVLQHFTDTLLTSDLPPAVHHLQKLFRTNVKTPRLLLDGDLVAAYDWIGDALRPINAPNDQNLSKPMADLARRADRAVKAYIRTKIPKVFHDDDAIVFIRSLYDAGHYWTCELAIQWYRPKSFREIQKVWPPILQAMILRHNPRMVKAAILATWPIFGHMILFGRNTIKHPLLAPKDTDSLGISLDVNDLLYRPLGSLKPVDVALTFVHLALGLCLSAAQRCLPDPALLAARSGSSTISNHLLIKYLIREILMRWANMRVADLNYFIG